MNILYCSTLCSRRLLLVFFEKGNRKPAYSIQKFHRLLATGFVENGAEVFTMTSMPFPQGVYGKRIKEADETEDGIHYHYASTWDLPVIKRLGQFFSSFFYVLGWCLRHKDNVVVFDVLNVSGCMGGLVAAKLTRTKTLGIVTDLPGYMSKEPGEHQSWNSRVNMSYMNSFSMYVLLTEQMNEKINLKCHPYIVMEGLVDHTMKPEKRMPDKDKRILVYAGGLYEKYGVKMLVDAYLNIMGMFPDTEMHIYGDGEMRDWLKKKDEKYSQFIYFGPRTNDEVVADELKATLLINPRPTHEDFTKYSFPSKNIEYMCSGTAVLTTRLPGMPKEYWDKVYIFKEETVKGYQRILEILLSKPREELDERGRLGQRFVLEKKNNVVQAKRVMGLISCCS